MKKLCAVLLALILTLSLSVAAFAADGGVQITVKEGETRTYAVYQIFVGDLDGSTLSNIKWGKNGTGTEGHSVSETVLNELKALTSSLSDTEKLAAIKKYVKLDSTSTPFGTVSNGSPLSVPTGYYLLKDVTTGLPEGQEHSAFVVEIVGPTEITAKAGQVTSEKKVQDVNDTAGIPSGWQDSADYDIGDDVPFQLTGTVSAKYDAYTSYFFCFHDTLSDGLTFNEDSVEVYVDGTKITSGYTVVTEGLSDGCTFEVKFTDLKTVKAAEDGPAIVKANSVIKVTYTARLNEGAVVGSAGNSNSMKLEYSNNPNDSTETGETPEDKVTVFTYKLVINKIDGDSKTALPGAGFTLYKKVMNTSTNEVEWKQIGAEVKTGTEFTWTGLDDGDYKLVETTTPPGYNTMADKEFTISATHDTSSEAPTLSELTGGSFGSGTISTGVVGGNIENNKGTVLPETGAMGTMLFVTFGSLLVAAAVVFLVVRKKMSIYQD